MQDYQRIFKGLKGKYLSAGRRKKENERKAKMRKKKQLVKNLSRIYNVCVAYPFGNGLSQCLVYPPSVRVPEICINTEDISTLSHINALQIANLISEDYFTNAAGSRLLTNLQRHVRDGVYCFLYPEESTQEIEVENVEDDDEDRESVDGQENVYDDQVSFNGDDDIESVDGKENVSDIWSSGEDDEDIESVDGQENVYNDQVLFNGDNDIKSVDGKENVSDIWSSEDDDEDLESVDGQENVNEIWSVGDDDEDIESVDRGKNVKYMWPVGDHDEDILLTSFDGQKNVDDQ